MFSTKEKVEPMKAFLQKRPDDVDGLHASARVDDGRQAGPPLARPRYVTSPAGQHVGTGHAKSRMTRSGRSGASWSQIVVRLGAFG